MTAHRRLASAVALTVLAGSVSAQTHLAVEVTAAPAFRDYFWLDGRFGGLLSDYLDLADLSYTIELFGPRSTDPMFPLDGMFYVLKVTLDVAGGQPQVRAISFDSYCAAAGTRSRVIDWPVPSLAPDARRPGAFRLLFDSPMLAARKTPCSPIPAPSMARWADAGVLKLLATSAPSAAEVWINGELAGKTDGGFNVPYRERQELIDVVVRTPGRVNCRWLLTPPFDGQRRLHCNLKTP